MNLTLLAQDARSTTVGWQPVPGAACYALEWSDRMSDTVRFRTAGQTRDCRFRFVRSTHIPYYLRLRALDEAGSTLELSPVLTTPLARVLYPQREALDRGLVAVATSAGVFLSWRLLRSEVDGYSATGLTGADCRVQERRAPCRCDGQHQLPGPRRHGRGPLCRGAGVCRAQGHRLQSRQCLGGRLL